MQSQELQNVLRAIKNLSPQEKQVVAEALHEDDDPGINEAGKPGFNDGNADSEPTSDAQQRQ